MTSVRIVLAMLIIATALASSLPVAAQPNEAVYFDATGFWVDAGFAAFWRANGGLETFGYPISRLFYQDGLHRQYFERAVFEHHDQHDDPAKVLAVRLGVVRMVERGLDDTAPFVARPAGQPPTAGARYYLETGHFLGGIFQEYWDAHGGLLAFGYPLSEPFYEPDASTGMLQRVQYFERVRMEHHPAGAGTPYEILLGHLGVEELRSRPVPPQALVPQQPTAADRDAPVIGPQPLSAGRELPCGFNMAFWTTDEHQADNEHYLELLRESGCEWVRLQFTWRSLEPFEGANINAYLWGYNQIVNLAVEQDSKVLVDVTHPPDWARPLDPRLPADPDAFGSFMGRLVGHFRGRVAAWQIWNEPNLIDENNGMIDPAGFLALARAAYPAVKQADPEALVVFPALAPNSLMMEDLALDDDWYLERLFALSDGEIADFFDVFGINAYGAGNSPDHYYPGNLADNPGWTNAPEFYFRHAEEYRRILKIAGAGDKPIWITETGWPTPNDTEVFGFGAWVTEELQAAYLLRAVEIIQTEWDWVDQVFIWHLNIMPYAGPTCPHAGFSVTDANGDPRPAYLALDRMMIGDD